MKETINNTGVLLFRCGYCGRFYVGDEYIDHDLFSDDELSQAPLGYCPNAQQEHYEQNPE